MGYFSNGSEGMSYEERFCGKCLHQNGCAVWVAHTIHNYKECNNDGSILHMLIPRSKNHLQNERCRMFVDRGLLSNLALQQFESAANDGL